jgi:NADH-quinone oxidoreductase subunit K
VSIVILAAALIGIGVFGLLSRRDLVAVLASIEVVMGGVFVLVVALPAIAPGVGGLSQARSLLVLVIAAAEAAVGLAAVFAAARATGRTRLDDMTEGRG